MYLAVTLCFLLSSFIFAYLAAKLGGKHEALKLAFISFCLLFVLMSFPVAKDMAMENSYYNYSTNSTVVSLLDRGLLVSQISFYGFLTYITIAFLVSMFGWLKDLIHDTRKKQGKE